MKSLVISLTLYFSAFSILHSFLHFSFHFFFFETNKKRKNKRKEIKDNNTMISNTLFFLYCNIPFSCTHSHIFAFTIFYYRPFHSWRMFFSWCVGLSYRTYYEFLCKCCFRCFFSTIYDFVEHITFTYCS